MQRRTLQSTQCHAAIESLASIRKSRRRVFENQLRETFFLPVVSCERGGPELVGESTKRPCAEATGAGRDDAFARPGLRLSRAGLDKQAQAIQVQAQALCGSEGKAKAAMHALEGSWSGADVELKALRLQFRVGLNEAETITE